MQNPIPSQPGDSAKHVFKIIKANTGVVTSRVTWARCHDRYLEELATHHREKNWKSICADMKTRFPELPINGKKCRERWITSIKHGINRLPLSETEDLMLVIHHHAYRNRWSMISKKMAARNSSCLKNNFYSLLKKVVRQVLMHSQGQVVDEVPAVQFYSAIYVCVTLADILENESTNKTTTNTTNTTVTTPTSAEGVSRTPPHILDFVHSLKVTPAMCRAYLVALNRAFLKSCPFIDQRTRDVFGPTDFDTLGKLFEDTTTLIPSLLHTSTPDIAICQALGKVALCHAMHCPLPLSTTYAVLPSPPTHPNFLCLANTEQLHPAINRSRHLPEFLHPFLTQPLPLDTAKRSYAVLTSFPWPTSR
jgi:hypothetical protein